MTCRYLFGPVTADFADQNLRRQRTSGECLTFDPAGATDLAIRPGGTWTAVTERLPPGWQPDFVALYLPYTVIPECLWSAPVPRIGLAADWNLLWHDYRRSLPACDLILTDVAGVEVMAREGIAHAQAFNIFGCERAYLEPPLEEKPRDIDVLFVGNLHPAVQRERLPWLGRLARLGDHRRVAIHTGVFGAEYRDLLRRARIVFNRSIRGECNRRAFEAAATGALLFQEAGNLETPAYFTDRRECVYYDNDNLLDLLEYYLDHEDERLAIAEAAHRRAAHYSFEDQWQTFIESKAWKIQTRRQGEEETRRKAPVPTSLSPCLPLSLSSCLPFSLSPALPRNEAIEHARRTLALIDRGDPISPATLDGGAYPPAFDFFRVEWERAAWTNAGDPRREADAKRQLLRWRLHSLLAELTQETAHYYEAALARPDLAPTQAALGCALARSGRLPDAVAHLRQALEQNPFDVQAARSLQGPGRERRPHGPAAPGRRAPPTGQSGAEGRSERAVDGPRASAGRGARLDHRSLLQRAGVHPALLGKRPAPHSAGLRASDRGQRVHRCHPRLPGRALRNVGQVFNLP